MQFPYHTRGNLLMGKREKEYLGNFLWDTRKRVFLLMFGHCFMYGCDAWSLCNLLAAVYSSLATFSQKSICQEWQRRTADSLKTFLRPWLVPPLELLHLWTFLSIIVTPNYLNHFEIYIQETMTKSVFTSILFLDDSRLWFTYWFMYDFDKYVWRADHTPDTALKAEDREDWALSSRSA